MLRARSSFRSPFFPPCCRKSEVFTAQDASTATVVASPQHAKHHAESYQRRLCCVFERVGRETVGHLFQRWRYRQKLLYWTFRKFRIVARMKRERRERDAEVRGGPLRCMTYRAVLEYDNSC